MLELNVAEGVHRVEDAYTNWYVVEEKRSLTIVDAGHPRSWGSLVEVLQRLGRTFAEIETIVLTHGHFDHVGFARRARGRGIAVWAPRRDADLVAHPWRYDHERPRIEYALRHPKFVGVFATMGMAGALWTRGITDARLFEPGQQLDVPGRPQVLATPGHTHGHCSLLLEERGVLIAGDAVVTFDPYTGRRRPQIVSRAATADSALALESVRALGSCGAATVLTGHGPAWRSGAKEIAERALEAGVS